MKKSKIIIPALAVLVFSTTAAVTGTVAWFQSASAAKLSATSFSITKLDGALSTSMTAGIGTKVSTSGTSVEPKSTTVSSKTTTANLTHGSFNIADNKVYTKNQEGDGYNYVGQVSTTGTNTDATFENDTSKMQYHVFSWQITFTFGSATAGPTDYDRNLYFDVGSDSKVEVTDSDTNKKLSDDHANTARAFRIAFISDDTTAKPFVWSPLSGTKYSLKTAGETADSSTAANLKSKYVSGTSATTDYTSSNLLAKGDSLTAITGGTAGGTDRKDYLGKFTSTDGQIKVYCVAWVEGCDTLNVLNDAALPTLKASMNFYVRKAATN